MSLATDLAKVALGRSKKSRYGRVGTAFTVVGIVRRGLKQKPEVVYRAEIKPGDRFELVGIDTAPSGRRARKKAARRK